MTLQGLVHNSRMILEMRGGQRVGAALQIRDNRPVQTHTVMLRNDGFGLIALL